jgi:hypothetical protein
MVVSIPFLSVNFLSRWLPGKSRNLFNEKALSCRGILGIFVVVMLFGVLRNIGVSPFTFLAPHG